MLHGANTNPGLRSNIFSWLVNAIGKLWPGVAERRVVDVVPPRSQCCCMADIHFDHGTVGVDLAERGHYRGVNIIRSPRV